jgi:uncharacterized protein YlxP (DUF503 family)
MQTLDCRSAVSRSLSYGNRRMIVGTLRVRLIIREARTLKDKRQVVKSIKDKLHNSFNVSVAEIESLENPRMAVLGMAMVSNETHHVKTALAQIVEALRGHPIAEFVDHEIETI